MCFGKHWMKEFKALHYLSKALALGNAHKTPFVLYLHIYTLVYIIGNIFSVESKVNVFQIESTFYLISCQTSVPDACKYHH